MEDALTSQVGSELSEEESPLILRITERLVSRESEYFDILQQQMQHGKTHALSPVGFMSGTIAGGVGVLAGHWLDTLKTRAQVGQAASGSVSQATAIPRTPLSRLGEVRALYRGVLGPLATAGVMQALNFGIYDNCRNALGYGPFVSAAIAGGLLSIINTPVGLVKVQEQVMPVDKKSSTLKRARAIFNGPKPIRSLYTGFGVNLVSESYGRGVYMWVYDWMKRYLAEPSATGELDLNVTNLSLGKRVIAAASAGVSSWFVIYPLDVIKSRMQSAPILRGTPYKNTMDCVRQTIKAEGVRALFRGLTFTLIRSAPVASAVLPIYDVVHLKLTELSVNW